MSAIVVGGQLAGLRIDDIAGQGGSSTVYRATEVATGEARAVKVLRDPNPSAVRRLRREAAMLGQLEHAAVVPFHGIHDIGAELALVTGWIDGETLRDHLRRTGRPDPDLARRILSEIASALAHIHDRGFLHRDVSPSNILVGESGSLTLIDLGIGHNDGATTLTNHDLLAGTPRYLAPEIIRGERASTASDQYSLAMVAFETAAGRSPFPDHEVLATALHHQIHTAPVPLDEIDPSLAGPFANAITQALAKEPRDRFGSVTHLAAAAAGAARSTNSATSGRGLSRRLWAVAAAASVVVGLGTAAWLVSRPGSLPDPDTTQTLAAPAGGARDVAVAPAPDEVQGVAVTPESTEELGVLQPDLGPTTVVRAWTEGLASTLACNQLTGSGFSDGSVPLDYYGDPPGRERVVSRGGVDDSWALEVGLADNYGQYSELIPVVPGATYWFRGWFSRQGPIDAAEMGIALLDENFTSLDITVKQEVAAAGSGFHELQIESLPDQAAYALPYLFKDSSPGVLLADELVFGLTDECFEQLSATGG